MTTARPARNVCNNEREHLLREREKWEKDHSGSYEIVYPSPDPERQATYEQLLFTCKELWETKGQPHNLNQVMERAKKQAVTESDGDGGAFAVQKDRSEATHGGRVEEGD